MASGNTLPTTFTYEGVAYLLSHSHGCQLAKSYFPDVIILVLKRLIEFPNFKSDGKFIAGNISSTRLKYQFSSISYRYFTTWILLLNSCPKTYFSAVLTSLSRYSGEIFD